MSNEIFQGFSFKREIDVGHFLTFLTLIAGFGWWLFTTIRSWRKTAEEDARSGALRLLLRLLRDKNGAPVRLSDLFQEFNSAGMKELRKAYCRKKWQFKDEMQFEAAIYRLDWEGKIKFASKDEVCFRLPIRYDSGGAVSSEVTSARPT